MHKEEGMGKEEEMSGKEKKAREREKSRRVSWKERVRGLEENNSAIFLQTVCNFLGRKFRRLHRPKIKTKSKFKFVPNIKSIQKKKKSITVLHTNHN